MNEELKDRIKQLENDLKGKVREIQNLSKFFFLMIYIWLDRARKTV